MRSLLTGLLSMLALAGGGFVLLCLLLYWRQEAAIFYPGPNDPRARQAFAPHRVEIASGEALLEGWWIENPDATSRATILYFGGNAEDVLYTTALSAKFGARHFFAVNYRSYGGSTGQPGQSELYADALAMYDHAIQRGVAARDIVVMGRSLGSAMATMLAGERTVGAAVLITPFESLAAVAETHYPWVPVRLLLRHPFPSEHWARKARAPALVIAAGNDRIVPPAHAHALFETWAGAKQILVLPGSGHNDVDADASFYPSISGFLISTLPIEPLTVQP